MWYETMMRQLKLAKYAPIQPLIEPLTKEFPEGDAELISIVREKYLIPPSTEDYSLESAPDFDTSMGQAEVVRKILGDQVRRTSADVGCTGAAFQAHQMTVDVPARAALKAHQVSVVPARLCMRTRWHL